jgi:hypothetical protein
VRLLDLGARVARNTCSIRPAPPDGFSETAEEVLATGVVPEDRPTFDPPLHHMVQGARSIQAWAARHGGVRLS